MDMFSKLKSAVSSALPGNPMAKDFEVFGQVASAGPGMMWKIYKGLKRTTKQDAAIFVFEKKCIERYSKRDKDFILDTLKRGASQLTRLRHPKILSVIQPLEESRESLAFATEPVFASLANVLGNHDNLPASAAKELQEYKMFEVEIKYGLLQVTEALQFLHNDAKLFHNNICPESIIVNKDGSWKMAGFDFCIPNQNPPEQAPLFPYKDWDPDIAPGAQPNLDYLAPEYALTESCGLPSDMFSVGVLIYSIFNNGKPLYECKTQLSSFKKNAEELRKWRGSLLGKIPKELQDIVKLLLNTEPAVRPDPNQLAKVSFFEDVGSMTLQYMDSLFQQDNLQKSKFFKGLPKIIAKLPKRVNLQRVLPPLLKECVNPDMIPFVLPNILQIAEQATDKEYVQYILPDLIPMFKLVVPIQILLIFMQNMNLLLKKTPAADIKTHVLPMIYRALESDSPQIQELCLSIIPTFADLIDYSSLKNSIVPRIKKLCLTTSTVGVRVNCLLCLGQLLEAMDKWFVLDEVLPLLPQIPSREPAVLMSILGIYKVSLTHSKLGITKDILAGKVLPFLITISIDNNLNLMQFNAYMALIKDMVERIEVDHRGKLQQLEQMKQEQKSLEITKVEGYDENTLISGIEDKPKTMMDNFLSGFGIASMTKGSGHKSNTPKPQAASTPEMKPPATSQPAKVVLTLEEKQRLARDQEQQRFQKTQKSLVDNKSAVSSASKPNPQTSNQPKDLTASLMQSNMMGLSSSSASKSSSFGSSNMSQSGFNSVGSSNFVPSVPMGMSSGQMSNTMGQSSFGMTPNYSSAKGNFSQSSSMSGQNKSVDLSSFDNLLPSSSTKPTPSMNQMSTSHRQTPLQQGMMGQGMMGQQMRGQGQPMMGSGFGGQSMNMGMGGMSSGGRMNYSGGGMINSGGGGMMNSGGGGMMNSGGGMMNMGGQMMNSGGFNANSYQAGGQGSMFPAQPMGGQNMMQPQSMGNSGNMSKNLSANELDDLLG